MSYDIGMDYTQVSVPIEDVLYKRSHQREQCPVENCTGEFDYLVLLRGVRGYRWRPDHQLPQGSEAVDRYERGLRRQEAALERVRTFLEDHKEVELSERVHSCPLFEDCRRYNTIFCKELCDFYLQSGGQLLIFPASHLKDLHLVDGMEEIYNSRVVSGSPAAKAMDLLMEGISVPPRGRIARPVVRSDTLGLGYLFAPYRNDDRTREFRIRPPPGL